MYLALSSYRRASVLFPLFSGGGVIGLLSREVLVSHGIVYWPHSLYQPFLAALLIVLHKALLGAPTFLSKKSLYYAIFSLAFIGGLIEWTGILFSLLASIVIFALPRYRNSRISLILAIAAFASLAIIAIHFSIALGPKDFLYTSISRFLSRSAKSASVFQLAKGYILSFAPWLLVCIISTLLVRFRNLRAALSTPGIAIMLLLSLLPLIENLLMLQHASQFSFDRLKAVFPIGIYLSVCFAIASDDKRKFIVPIILTASAISFLQYQFEIRSARDFSPVHASNLKLVQEIGRTIDVSCASISSAMKVRGYDNVLFNRAIHENQSSPQKAWEAMVQNGGCGSVWIDGFQYAPDIPSYQKAIVQLPDGKSFALNN